MLARAFRRRTQVNIAIALLAAVWMDASSKSSLADKNFLRTKDSTATSPPQNPPKVLEEELRALTQEFGVLSENIPDDFIEKVRRWARLYQTRDRDEMERVLRTLRKDFEAVQQQLANANLPPELAFVTLVESHFQAHAVSPTDNAGLWQFTRDTARRNGLKVNAHVDERLDPLKSTQAACRYISRLRRDLGPDGSFLLAIAAYNMGPGRLKQRMLQVQNPLNRHDFWYLYRVRVLPAITRTHIARLMAAILIGRHPQHFGFKSPTSNHLSTISTLPLSASTSVLR
jgi:membrane-bound lytic murein transglycosylase D